MISVIIIIAVTFIKKKPVNHYPCHINLILVYGQAHYYGVKSKVYGISNFENYIYTGMSTFIHVIKTKHIKLKKKKMIFRPSDTLY